MFQPRVVEDGFIDPLDRTWGWSKVSAMPGEVNDVPGDHFTILTEPHVSALGDLLKRHLTL